MNRRHFLRGAVAAPFVITTPGILMPVRKLWTPQESLTEATLERMLVDLYTAKDARAIPLGHWSFVQCGFRSEVQPDGSTRLRWFSEAVPASKVYP